MNTTNIIIVGLIGGLVTIGTTYFILKKLADFQWWWLVALFGAQFLTIILTLYILSQNFGCSLKAVASCSNQQTIDWCDLRKADTPPKITSKSPASKDDDVNAADWQDLLQQLDQMSKEPVVAAVKAPDVSNNIIICPPASQTSTQPTPTAVFDFSSIVRTFSSTAAKASASDIPVTQAVSSAPAPIIQGIDFASLFK